MTDFSEMKERVDRERMKKEKEKAWIFHNMRFYDDIGNKSKYLEEKKKYESKLKEIAAMPPIEKLFGEL